MYPGQPRAATPQADDYGQLPSAGDESSSPMVWCAGNRRAFKGENWPNTIKTEQSDNLNPNVLCASSATMRDSYACVRLNNAWLIWRVVQLALSPPYSHCGKVFYLSLIHISEPTRPY